MLDTQTAGSYEESLIVLVFSRKFGCLFSIEYKRSCVVVSGDALAFFHCNSNKFLRRYINLDDGCIFTLQTQKNSDFLRTNRLKKKKRKGSEVGRKRYNNNNRWHNNPIGSGP